jgi:hypothetical protein
LLLLKLLLNEIVVPRRRVKGIVGFASMTLLLREEERRGGVGVNGTEEV